MSPGSLFSNMMKSTESRREESTMLKDSTSPSSHYSWFLMDYQLLYLGRIFFVKCIGLNNGRSRSVTSSPMKKTKQKKCLLLSASCCNPALSLCHKISDYLVQDYIRQLTNLKQLCTEALLFVH